MNLTIALLFKCILATGGTVYQDVPCKDTPYWATQGSSIQQQEEIVIVPITPEEVAAAQERAAKDIAKYHRIMEREAEERRLQMEVQLQEQKRNSDKQLRCNQWNSEIQYWESLDQQIFGDLRVHARATAERAKFRFECW